MLVATLFLQWWWWWRQRRQQWWRQQQHDKEAEGDTKAGHSITDAQEAAQTSHTLSVSTAIEAYAFW